MQEDNRWQRSRELEFNTLLPFLVGVLVPEDELAWQVLLDLKEIVELAVALVHTDETVAYLDVKSSL